MTELKTCPVCGKPVELEGGQSWHDQHRFLIKCYECGCSRVSDTDKDECVRRWNALPRPLRWTKKSPTEPGWYFFRGNIPGYHENNPPVYVDVHQNKVVLVRRASWVLSNLIIKYDIEWAGPIQEPVE